MAITALTKAGLDILFLALTPVERWEAARRFSSNSTVERPFIFIGVIAIIALAVVFFMISFNRTRQMKKVADSRFAEYSRKIGLSGRERQILFDISNKAGLKQKDSIFTLDTAFNRGVAKIKKVLEGGQETKANNRLKSELTVIREKLGFQKASAGSTAKLKKLSSRQIPIGKKLLITRRKGQDTGDIESTVTQNTDTKLAVELTTPVKITFGEYWCVRYHFGVSVWEFDTSVVSYDGRTLVLNHSNDIRFINRRRFVRVPVRKPAFIARFPFARTASDGNKEAAVNQNSGITSFRTLRLPEFVPGVVTELAGPGLRIESTLEVRTGQRVLVVFGLDDEQESNSIVTSGGSNSAISKIVEDIGEVRHTREIKNGLSIAVELTGLSDADIDDLIRATNAAMVRANANTNVSASAELQERVSKPAASQGV